MRTKAKRKASPKRHAQAAMKLGSKFQEGHTNLTTAQHSDLQTRLIAAGHRQVGTTEKEETHS